MTDRWRRPARVLPRIIGSTLVAALLVGWPSAPADAHASAVASWPAVGQTMTASPDRVIIEFSTEVLPDVLVAVVDADGQSIADGDPVVEGQYVSQALVPSESAGAYNASVHVIGADMHPIIARVDFVVDPAGVATDNPAGDPPDLAADGDAVDAGPAATTEEDGSGGSGLLLMGVGLGLVVVLIVVLRLAGRRRTPAGRRRTPA